jgi:HK97 family phage major capsid protein
MTELELKAEVEKLKALEVQYLKVLNKQAADELETLERTKLQKIKDEIKAELMLVNAPKPKALFTVTDEEKASGKKALGLRDFLELVRVGDPSIAHLKTIADPMSTTSAQGGYTIPTPLSADILGRLNEQSVAWAECTPVEITQGNSIALNSILTDLTVGWSTEATAKNTTKPTLSQATLSMRFIYAIVVRTQELANGTIANLDQFIKNLVSENFMLEFDAQILQAAAAPFTGILNAVGVNSVGQVGASLAYPDLTAVINNTGQLSYFKTGAKWWMTLGGLDTIMNIVDLNGRPLWSLNDPMNGKPSSIMGYPYNISDQITDAISTGGTTSIVFGNMKNEYKAVRPGGGGISVLYNNLGVISTSTSVTHNLFQSNMEAWRFELETGLITAIPAAFVKLINVKP